MLGRSGIVLLIGFVCADGLCKRHVQTVAVALFAALDGAYGGERNNNSWRFVFHMHRLLSLHKRGFGNGPLASRLSGKNSPYRRLVQCSRASAHRAHSETDAPS